MARTKQTARKNSGGKPLAMGRGRGRGKGNPKSNPKPGGRVDRKVVLEFSSDESLDEDNPQPVEGAGAPKRVKKLIHLTLPTNPAHVTTTETFTTFFINHGLMKALQKAFEKRGWSTDQMQEFIMNFQQKHGKRVPLPKLYGDDDTSDSEGKSWRTAPQWAKRPPAVQVTRVEEERRNHPPVAAVPVQVAAEAVHTAVAVPVQAVAAPVQVTAVA